MSASLTTLPDGIEQLTISGKLTQSDFAAAQGRLAAIIGAQGTTKLLVVMENFEGWERNRDWADTDFQFNYGDGITKIGIVGDPQWEADALAFSGAGVRRTEIRFFPAPRTSDALAWLKSAD